MTANQSDMQQFTAPHTEYFSAISMIYFVLKSIGRSILRIITKKGITSMAITIDFGDWVFGLIFVYTGKTQMDGENCPKYLAQPAMNLVMLRIIPILLIITKILQPSI